MNRPRILILDGPRMTGKSTIARYLRNNINYATLINLTGFPDKGILGSVKMQKYYMNWLEYVKSHAGDEMTIIFDRHMFSEVVFSRLYKEYDFGDYYEWMLDGLVAVADVEVIFLELNSDEEITKRAGRNKVEYADVADNVLEISKQRKGYKQLAKEMKQSGIAGKMKFSQVAVDGKESIDIAKEIVARWN